MARIDSTIRDRFQDALKGDDPKDTAHEWDQLAFRAGLGLQQAELNELQSVINYYLKGLGKTQLREGTLLYGAETSRIDATNRYLEIGDGHFFFDGKVRRVFGKRSPGLYIPFDFQTHVVGLITHVGKDAQLIDEVGGIIPLDAAGHPQFNSPSVGDPSLVDPVQADLSNSGFPGAMRVRVYAEWAVDETDTTRFRPVYKIPAPVVNPITGAITQPPPILISPLRIDVELSELERRTYEWFGQFKLSGFTGAFDCSRKYEVAVAQLTDAANTSTSELLLTDRRSISPGDQLVIGMGLPDEEVKFVDSAYIGGQIGAGAVPLYGQLASTHAAGEVIGKRDVTLLPLQMEGGIAYVNGTRIEVTTPSVIAVPKALTTQARTQGITVIDSPALTYGESAFVPPADTGYIPPIDEDPTNGLSGAAVSTADAFGTQGWANTETLKSIGGQPAYTLLGSLHRTQYLAATGFVSADDLTAQASLLSGTTINLTDITITGIEVRIRRRTLQPAPVRDYAVHLYTHGFPSTVIATSDNKAQTDQTWPSTDFQDAVYGGPNDLWGLAETQGVYGQALGIDKFVGDNPIGVALGIHLLSPSSGPSVGASAMVDSIRLILHYTVRNDSAFTYQLDQPFVDQVSVVEANVLSPMMSFTKTSGTQLLPAIASVVDPTNAYWKDRVLPNSTDPGAGSLYQVITYGVNAAGNPSATLVLGTALNVPAGVLTGTTYVEGVDFTRSGDNITWISGPADGTTLYARWVYSTDNGMSQARMRVGGRVRTLVTDAQGTMPASFQPELDVAVAIVSSTLVPIKDVFSLITVSSGATTYINGQDYYLDSGRRADSIGQARVIWRGGGNRPGVGDKFNVTLEYWSSTGLVEGDFIAPGSYVESDGRTRITDRHLLRQADENAWVGDPPDLSNPNQFLTKLDLATDVADSLDFRVAGRRPIKVTGANIMTATYTYFLARMDVLTLDDQGAITLQTGTPAAAAQLPPIQSELLPLLYISHDPGDDCPKVREAPSTMFTIPDLVNMVRRLENLETATLTSLLEQRGEAASANMIKRGIFSDPFKDFSRSDTTFAKTANSDLAGSDGGGLVRFNCAMATLAQTLRLPFDLLPWNLTVDKAGSSGIYFGSQVTMLSFTEKAILEQRSATRGQLLNPSNSLPPPMTVDLLPGFDFWVDDEQTPEQAVPVTDLSTRDTSPIEAQARPVFSRKSTQTATPLKATPARTDAGGQLYRWWGAFHSGQPQSKTDLPLEFATTSHNEVYTDGSTARAVPRITNREKPSKPSAALLGFIERAGRQRQRHATQTVNETVVSRDVIPYIRQRSVTATGHLFPPSREVRATFDGKPIPLTAAGGTLPGSSPGSVLADIHGDFTATFVIPGNKFTGSPQVTFISSVQRNAQGPRRPTDVDVIQSSGASRPWLHSTAILDEFENTFADCALPGNTNSSVLLAKDFGFAVPTGSTVTGITARISRTKIGGSDRGPIRDYKIQLWKDPYTAPVGANRANTDLDWYDEQYLEAIYGGISDLWGTTWTAEEINSSLALGIQVTNTGVLARARVASVEMTVYFTTPDGAAQEVTASAAYVATGQLRTSTGTYSSASTLPLAAARADGALAQTFTLNDDRWITSADLYFRTRPAAPAASTDNDPPGVEIQIRNVTPNGGPGSQVLGRVIVKRDDVAVSNVDALSPTTVTFTDPVFIRRGVPHALVICTDSDAYSVWVADIGKPSLTGASITKDPVAGELWTSNNGSTWHPSLGTDLSFVLRTAQLTKGQSGLLKFNPVTLSGTGNSLSIFAQSLLPVHTALTWEVSLDGQTNWIPVQPGVDLTTAQEYSAVHVRAHLSVDFERADPTASPAINPQTCGLTTYVNGGEEQIEDLVTYYVGDYVSLNYPIESFEECRIITDEFVPDGTSMIPFVSVNDGVEWLPLQTESSRVDLDNGVEEVTRRLNVPAWIPGHSYNVGDVVRASATTLQNVANSGIGHVFKCVQAGVSASAASSPGSPTSGEPGDVDTTSAWNTGPRALTIDRLVAPKTPAVSYPIWQECGQWPFTQFRARLRLATTNKAVTPQVANLVLLALGDPGQIVYSPSGSLF